MGSFDYYRHAERMQGLLDAIADFDCEPLLDLKPAGECLDHPGNFAQAGDFAVRVLLCIRDIDVTLGELKQKLDTLDTDKKITKISYYSDKTSFENGVETTDESVKIIDGSLQTIRVFYTENGEEKLVEHTVIPKGFDLGKAYSVAFTLTEELSDLTTAEKLKERVSALDPEKEITAIRIERTSPETNAKTEITAGELKENDLVFLADSTSEYCFRISAEGK